jgi:hypothetical protein
MTVFYIIGLGYQGRLDSLKLRTTASMSNVYSWRSVNPANRSTYNATLTIF